MLLILRSTGDKLLRNVNIDDLKPKIGVIVIFSQFQAATRISGVNCAEIDGDIPRQSAYEIFSIEYRF